jgi:hypothetical protein
MADEDSCLNCILPVEMSGEAKYRLLKSHAFGIANVGSRCIADVGTATTLPVKSAWAARLVSANAAASRQRVRD